MWIGVISVILASIGLGSVYVPCKRYPMGDGFFAQLLICLGSFLICIPIHFAQGNPPIFPIAMIGGATWAISNAFAVKLIALLGMGIACLLWRIVSCLIGWAMSRFGLFGLPKEEPQSVFLNYAGVVILMFGGLLYNFVQSDLKNCRNVKVEYGIDLDEKEEEKEPSMAMRMIGVVGALLCGIGYGLQLSGITFLQTHPDFGMGNNPSDGLPYVFSFFLGAIVTSTVIFIFYSVVKKGRPEMNSQLVLPALSAGGLFGITVALFIVASGRLSPTIAFPVYCMFPGLIVSLWSVLYFREITGKRNIILLSIAYCITLVGVIMVVLSKQYALPFIDE